MQLMLRKLFSSKPNSKAEAVIDIQNISYCHVKYDTFYVSLEVYAYVNQSFFYNELGRMSTTKLLFLVNLQLL